MFKEETLFILGAGASYPYNYPLGKDLIKQIIENIDSDPIYLPVLQSGQNYFWNENQGIEKDGKISNGYAFGDFIEHFEQNELNIFREIHRRRPQTLRMLNASFSINSINYIEVPLKKITEFFNLKKALIEFDPVSIDSFLRDHPSYALTGKIMIIYSLLKCEDKSRIGFENRTGSDNWYSYLINDILSGCNEPKDVLQNKLNIITFNYSVDLDYCLFHKLANVEILKNDAGSEFIEELKNVRIKHVYGQLYSDNIIETYGQFFQDPNRNRHPHDLNTQRFMKAIQSRDKIKLIQSERKHQQQYVDLIGNAKQIIVIGFGFDRDNLNILGFPDQFTSYREFLNYKNFKYMDYKGQMNSLYDQFLSIQKGLSLPPITRSTADSIISAYQNDFKINLYQ